MIVTDLETVDPKGRLDVLIYRGAQWFAEQMEQKHGLAGIWDNAKPIVNQIVVEGVSGIEIPAELKMILGIVQANWNRGEKK
jgi:hypothetical protein